MDFENSPPQYLDGGQEVPIPYTRIPLPRREVSGRILEEGYKVPLTEERFRTGDLLTLTLSNRSSVTFEVTGFTPVISIVGNPHRYPSLKVRTLNEEGNKELFLLGQQIKEIYEEDSVGNGSLVIGEEVLMFSPNFRENEINSIGSLVGDEEEDDGMQENFFILGDKKENNVLRSIVVQRRMDDGTYQRIIRWGKTVDKDDMKLKEVSEDFSRIEAIFEKGCRLIMGELKDPPGGRCLGSSKQFSDKDGTFILEVASSIRSGRPTSLFYENLEEFIEIEIDYFDPENKLQRPYSTYICIVSTMVNNRKLDIKYLVSSEPTLDGGIEILSAEMEDEYGFELMDIGILSIDGEFKVIIDDEVSDEYTVSYSDVDNTVCLYSKEGKELVRIPKLELTQIEDAISDLLSPGK